MYYLNTFVKVSSAFAKSSVSCVKVGPVRFAHQLGSLVTLLSFTD